MKRKFNTFDITKIKNNGEKDFHLPQYRNRSQTSETIKPEQELPFELSEFGSSVYYYRNTKNFDVEAKNLYSDGEGPQPPVEKQYIYEKGEDSVYFNLYTPSGSDYDYVEVGTNLIPGNDYEIWGLELQEYDLYINDIFIETGGNCMSFTLTEDMSVDNKVIITVKRHENRLIFHSDFNENTYIEVGVNIEGKHKVTLHNGDSIAVSQIPTNDVGDFHIDLYPDYREEETEADVRCYYEGEYAGYKGHFIYFDGSEIYYGTSTDHEDNWIVSRIVSNLDIYVTKKSSTAGSDIILSNGDEVVDAEGNDLTVE